VLRYKFYTQIPTDNNILSYPVFTPYNQQRIALLISRMVNPTDNVFRY
jgi:hypothetical protein